MREIIKKIERVRKRRIETVELGLKPYILDTLYLRFREREFLKSDFLEAVYRSTSFNMSEVRATKFVYTLVNSNWLNSKRIKKGNVKDCQVYFLSKKAQNYERKYGSFLNPDAPLMKSKESKTEYIEKEVPVEKRLIEKDKFIGEI